jgi:hypothetical protein
MAQSTPFEPWQNVRTVHNLPADEIISPLDQAPIRSMIQSHQGHPMAVSFVTRNYVGQCGLRRVDGE